MSDNFFLELLTPAGKVFSGNISDATVPTSRGECGILAQHDDVVGLVSPGILKVTSAETNSVTKYAVSSGMFSVEGNRVSLLVDSALTKDALAPVATINNRISEVSKSLDNKSFEESSQARAALGFLESQLELHK